MMVVTESSRIMGEASSSRDSGMGRRVQKVGQATLGQCPAAEVVISFAQPPTGVKTLIRPPVCFFLAIVGVKQTTSTTSVFFVLIYTGAKFTIDHEAVLFFFRFT